MAIPDWVQPTTQWTHYIPKRLDGTGVVGLHMTAGNMKYFKLDEMPSAEHRRVIDPRGDMKFFSMPGRKRSAYNGSYRLAYKWIEGRKKPLSCRFRLSGEQRIETLQVITNYLNSIDVEWLHISNYANNNVYRPSFSSIA